jgi:hypothetical protein
VLEDVGKPPQQHQAQQQSQQLQTYGYGDMGYGDPYALPYDPYMSRPSQSNWNVQMMLAVLDTKITPQTDFDSYREMIAVVLDSLARIPNINSISVRRLNRDFADICDLASCQGTKRMVASRMQKVLFEIRSLMACGENQLPGITAVSAIITSRQQQEQTVRMPPQLPEQRKKIFGVF